MLTQFPTAQRLPNTRPAAKSSVTTVSGRLRVEEKAADHPVIAILNSRWRVVVGKNEIQWVLQNRGGPARWYDRYFCRSREGLTFCAREYAGEISAVAFVRLLRLPMWIGGAP